MKTQNVFMFVFLFCFSSMAFARNYQAGMKKYDSVVLTFEQGSSNLGSVEMDKLKSAVNSAKGQGNISMVEIAVWSDKEHPMTGSLSDADQKLARERIQSIKSALRDETSRFERISTYNMTDNSHWLGRRLHTNEAELDAVFAKKESGAMARKDFELIKKEGGPSKGVVIFNIKEK